MASTGSLATRVIAAVFLIGNLCGCQSLYLHSDSVQKSTAQSKTEFEKLNLASLFDNEAAYLDDLQKREYAAVADSVAGQRDDSLMTVLHGSGAMDGRTYLKRHIDGYLTAVAGISDRGGEVKFSALIANSLKGVSDGSGLADDLAQKLKDNRPKFVPPKDSFPQLFSPSGNTLDDAIKSVQDAANDLKQKKAAAEKARKELSDSLAAATQALSQHNSSQDAFDTLVKNVNAKLQEAKDKSNPYLGQYISETLQDYLDRLIAVTDSGNTETTQDATAKAAIGVIHAAFGVGDAFSNPPRVPHPNALAATRSWLQYLASQSKMQLEQETARQNVLRARLVAVAQQVYYLSLAGGALEPVSTEPKLDQKAGMEKLLADKDSNHSHAAAAALYYYSAAWTRGFIPDQQLKEVTLPLAERRAKLQQSRATGDAWVGVLKPAVTTLAAYGEGGLDPQAIANLLQAVGIGAIAVGVN